MAAPANFSISGATTLTLSDNTAILLHQMRANFVAFAAASAVVVFIVELAVFLSADFDYGLQNPGALIVRIASDIWPIVISMWVAYPVLLWALSSVRWRRIPVENKDVTYRADETGLTTSDVAGASFHLPWSMVLRSWKTRIFIIMKLKSGGMRFAPLRAFSVPDGEKLWRLVRENTPARQSGADDTAR